MLPLLEGAALSPSSMIPVTVAALSYLCCRTLHSQPLLSTEAMEGQSFETQHSWNYYRHGGVLEKNKTTKKKGSIRFSRRDGA